MMVIDPDNIPVALVAQENMIRETEDVHVQTKDHDDDDDAPLSCYGVVLCLVCGICMVTKNACDEGAFF